MKKIFRFVMVAPLMASLLILQNCGPKGDVCEDHDPVNTYYHISEADKSKIPFTGTDTLVYISTDGDTATLYGQGKKVLADKVAMKWGRDPGCSNYDYDFLEYISFTYIGDHPILKKLVFRAFINDIKEGNADISLNDIYKNDGYRLGIISKDINYRDSVEIMNVIYYGLNIYSGSAMFLYNRKYGFLSLEFDSKIWKLQLSL